MMTDETLRLTELPEGLSLVRGDLKLTAGFDRMIRRARQGNLEKELLVKACRIRGIDHDPLVWDAMAGLGEDGFLLASAGFLVELFEKNDIIAALLEDALRRAKEDPASAEAVSRMRLHRQDSIEAMKNYTGPAPDVIYLDPMFPERQKSALVKKKFQLLHELECPCMEEEELLMAALSVRPRRIVIKRPAKGPLLAGREPDFFYQGKAVRFDVILPSP